MVFATFPYTGYLGLTTLRVDGVVRTKLDADQKTLPAKSVTISVRCYETRLGVLGVMQSNVLVDYTQVLWSKPDGDHSDYAEIGDLELPFRILIPPKVAGFSTASYSSVYKCSWRVEAIINHVPILGVGSRQIKHSELPLLRFGLPPAYEPSTPIAKPLLDSEISQSHSPSIRYSVNSPTTPIGPLDLVSIPIHLLPSDPSVAFRGASVTIERRMRFFDPSSPPTTPTIPSNTSPTSSTLPSLHPSSSLPIPQRTSSSSSSLASSSPSSSYKESSSYLSSSTAALQPPDSRSSATGASVLVNSVAGTESSGLFARSESGMWSKTLTLQWPAAKSHSRWAIGETMESELVSVKFFVRVKIVVSSSFGTESLELEEKELLVVSTNDAERQLALSKYNDSYSDSARSKSKSPRRSSRRTNEDGTNAPPLPASASRAEHRVSSSTSHYSSGSPSSKPPRRPHTSAGPRDKSRTGVGSVSASDAETKDTERRDPFRRRRGTRPDTGNGAGADAEIAASHRDGSKSYSRAPSAPLTVTTTLVDSGSASSTSLSTSTSSSSVDSNPSDEMREWEEELARIEMRSRRSSDLVGFANKRRRPGEIP
ncbi:hypothetical protein MVEN_02069800 [Mycena venus]|uniref:Uncharacterized protein n=1 Tax=Mycena venus TaxID=2733690 RepID=A0A8H7CI14_9AGAR|nr:hypothetical protein MVEN_02069800 [Mycena venus]